MSKVRVLGIQNLHSKDGKPYVILHVSEPFRDSSVGFGSLVKNVFINESIRLDPKIVPGCDVDISYSCGYNGKAYVDGVTYMENK